MEIQEYPATHILREINFGELKTSKTVIWTILEALNFDFGAIFANLTFSKIKFQTYQNCHK